MASRSIYDLNLPTRSRAAEFIKACQDAGIDVLIYCTYRSGEEQDELYKIGRTVKGANPRLLRPMGDIVTNARSGESWHQFRCAFDFVPLVGGKPAWKDEQLYAICGQIAESVGLEWAGRWTGSLKETAHCQYRGGLTLAQARHGAAVV